MVLQEVLSRGIAADDAFGVVGLNRIIDNSPGHPRAAGTAFQVMQQSGGRDKATFAHSTGIAPEITERMKFQRGQTLFRVDLFDNLSSANVATVGVFAVEDPLWVNGSVVLCNDVSVQRGLATVLSAYLARYPLMDLVVEMLIQSMLADEFLFAVTAPNLGGVEGLEMLDRCGLKVENHLAFATITVLFGSLMIFKGM